MIELIIDNSAKLGKKRMTIEEMMLASGYTTSVARGQTKVLKGIKNKPEYQDFVKQLEAKRQQAIDDIDNKISEASYRDLVGGIDIFTKNIELLSGRATSREEVIEEEQINALLVRRTKKNSSGGEI